MALWVTEDGRISVDPIRLLVEDPPSVPPATVTDVDDLLVAVGRLRQDLRYPNEPTRPLVDAQLLKDIAS